MEMDARQLAEKESFIVNLTLFLSVNRYPVTSATMINCGMLMAMAYTH